ncbi:nuclear transport factor 2 family protein [Lacinutrix sp.]|uniref:nuclear transport factor 2 family protein n=1 Tax=Lacinutrix sp. TaxID=1937692 RepID=UPI0025BC2965|nr:nuclear transport factor 2 family protein [Lacinutrix sp.]
MSSKKIVKAFYDSNLATDENIIDMFHDDSILNWNSSQGFTALNKDGISEMLKGIKESYLSFSYRLSHLLEDDNTVTARYTIYYTTIERPLKEEPLAHFISIWEVKDGKIYKGFEISQKLDESVENLTSFSEIKM